MTDGYVVGAYAASPTAAGWDPALDAEYYEALASDPRIAAFETPWNGSLHVQDEDWLLAHFPPQLGAVLTDVASTFLTTKENPGYGLASNDRDGRALSVADARRMRDDMYRFHDRAGRPIVTSVELHSAPRASYGSADALARSLDELAAWDWDGAELVIEHCDALVPAHEPEKGFLALTDEIAAITGSGAPVGIALNWGRSAIEFHDPDRVTEHIAAARQAGLLRGYILSGASDEEGYFDRPWVDAHNMFRRSSQHQNGDPISLLTDERARTAVRAVGDGVWLGVKLGWPAQRPGSVAERVDMIRDALDAIDRARRHRVIQRLRNT